MEIGLNPYSPGAGRMPSELVGRQTQIEYFDRLVAQSKRRRYDRGMVLTGLRGVGKTVLLNTLRNHANHHGWMTVGMEGQVSEAGSVAVRTRLGRDLNNSARRFKSKLAGSQFFEQLRGVIGTFTLTLGPVAMAVDAPLSMNRAGSGVLETDLLELVEDLCEALKAENSALGIFVDEMQDLDDELLAALLTAQHYATQNNLPFFLFGAGLPNLLGELTKARTYAERMFLYSSIGALNSEGTKTALSAPARKAGVTYEQAGLALLAKESGGYPFFIQEFGNAAWNLASSKVISLEECQAALESGWDLLDDGFFPARWDRAAPKERQYLAAMADDNDEPSATPDVAARMKSTLAKLSTVRQRLIDKGIVYPPAQGLIAYTVPGMASYVRRKQGDTVVTSEDATNGCD